MPILSSKDILQELIEAELDASLGYEKIRRVIWAPRTNAMTIPKRLSKAIMANLRWTCPEIGMRSLSQNSIPDISVTSLGLKKVSSPCMPEEWAQGICMTNCRISMGLDYQQVWSARLRIRSCLR